MIGDEFEPGHDVPPWKVTMVREIVGKGFSKKELEKVIDIAENGYEDRVGNVPYKLARTLAGAGLVVGLVALTVLPVPTAVKLGGWVLGAVVFFFLPSQRGWRARLSLALYDQGIRPIKCAACDYDLKGSSALQCPECGAPLAKNERSYQRDREDTL